LEKGANGVRSAWSYPSVPVKLGEKVEYLSAGSASPHISMASAKRLFELNLVRELNFSHEIGVAAVTAHVNGP
jgi:hypothetical protein